MIVVLGIVVALDVIFSLVDELGEAGINYHAGNAVMFVLLQPLPVCMNHALRRPRGCPDWSGCSRFQ